jgi:hypothetical protein
MTFASRLSKDRMTAIIQVGSLGTEDEYCVGCAGTRREWRRRKSQGSF